MGIRCIGYEVVCNVCGKIGGTFAIWREAEDFLCSSEWAWYLVSAECPECSGEAKKAEAAR